MITRDEIHITQEVIGKGGWGEVRVANFRGLRVAAKCLHDLIISHYNISIFNREMDIASKVRHPNLLQFIGATQEGTPPIILCELMPTSLNHQLQTNPLTRPQIIRISQDVSCALNYLHLYRPHPILHRDVSSSNVLLQPSVDGGWKAKLSDYGSANFIQDISPTSEIMPGCFSYAAPEARFPDDHSPAMDVYSLGVLLMEMVLCQSPSFTTSERERQADTISWPSMKRLVKGCINRQSSNRPSIAVVLDHLKTL
jgi:serine/threonine protein kinase